MSIINSSPPGVKPGSSAPCAYHDPDPCPLASLCDDCAAEAEWLAIEDRLLDPDTRRGRLLLDSGDLAEIESAPYSRDDLDWEARRSAAHAAGWDDARRGLPRRDGEGYSGFEWVAYIQGRTLFMVVMAEEMDEQDERIMLGEPGDGDGNGWPEAERVAVLGARVYRGEGGA